MTDAHCGMPPGRFAPQIDRSRCEACGHCVSACPERAITRVRVDANNPRHAPTAAD